MRRTSRRPSKKAWALSALLLGLASAGSIPSALGPATDGRGAVPVVPPVARREGATLAELPDQGGGVTRLEDEPARLRRLRREAKALEERRRETGGEEERVLADLAVLTAERDLAAAESREAARALSDLERQGQVAAERAARARRSSDEARRRLAGRLVALRRRGPGAGLAVLASSPGPEEAIRALRALTDFSHLEWSAARRALRAAAQAESEENRLDEVRRDREAAARQASIAEAGAAAALGRQETRLTAVRRREDLYARAAREMERAAAELTDFLTGQRAAPPIGPDPLTLKGALPWPAYGKTLAPFGPRRHPRFGTLVPHPGIDIGAPSGDSVRAVADGTVAFADWFEGYGRTVILDHGAGLMTVVAHLAGIFVERGQRVDVGHLLGIVGDSGTLEGPRLYFEIREAGRPVDPRDWLVPPAR